MAKKPFGAVLIHGISATPENIQPVAPFLEELGLPVSLPTLRGHGAASPLALKGVAWQDWIQDGEKAMHEVLEEAEKVIIIGHSMGGWIAMNLAADYPDVIDSIVVAGASTLIVSPLGPFRPLHFVTPVMLKLLKKWDMPPVFADPDLLYRDPTYPWVPIKVFEPMFEFLRVTHDRLPEVHVPVLILHSRRDTSNSPDGVEILIRRLGTPEDQKRVVWFERTEHEMFLDCEAEAVIETVMDFVEERIGVKEAV